MLRRSLVVVALCACGDRSEPATPTPSSPGPVTGAPSDAGAPQRIVTATHSAQIANVAVSDRADAAISADETGELRFWPKLDGTREPVVIGGRAPVDLALAREHDGYVAALLDSAGGIELLHIAESGGLRSRQVVPAEPAVEELAAASTVLLARRTDHTIVRLDSNAKPSRPLAPETGEQVLAISARRSTAIAGIGDRDRPSEIRWIREIRITGELAWGRQHELPVPLAPPIAVSPSGTRIAGLHARTGAGVVLELVPKPRVVATDIVGTNPAEDVIGFLDDERAVLRGGVIMTVTQVAPSADPWDTVRSTLRARLGRNGVVGDGAVVSGQGTSLMIANGERVQFLGYRDVGVGFMRVTGDQITLGYGNRVLWLDDKLERLRAIDVVNDSANGLAVDDTHLLKATFSYLEDNRSRLDVSLVEVASDKEVPLGGWFRGSTVTYDPSSQVFAVAGFESPIARSQLDVASGKSTPLRAIKARIDSTIELLDPKLAGGAIAVSYAFADGGMKIDTYVDDGKSTRPLTPTSTAKVTDATFPVGVDQTGTMYTLVTRPETEAKPLYAHKAGKEVKRVMVDGTVSAGSVDRAGTMLVAYSSQIIILYEMDGKERWRVPAWSVNMARFTADGKTLLVNTQGGLIALDTRTGERRATGCSWGFGLSTTEPPLTVFNTPVVCAEAK
ncbi:MAG: hypothetical protein M4D80_27895 [Myxococcota bacterium]|nr:hypothetical protein [Myxococcota bacterium]